jgi:glycosyltransferase involved in cell wall biosynthesis
MAAIGAGNAFLMRKPTRLSQPEFQSNVVVLIPARNEAENLKELIPQLSAQCRVIVCDDESEDGTAEVARSHGAQVISPGEPLPFGWTGKNRACHLLAQVALESTDCKWWIFLDADARVSSDFVASSVALAEQMPRNWAVLTGFPNILPGKFPEPLFLGWVGWILLSTNPFFLVSRTRKSHNRFTNGQITVWRSSVYAELWPNEQLKGRILEDVMIGRLLAKNGYGVDVVNLASTLKVRMYDTWKAAFDGMSKNSFEIIGSAIGTVLLSAWLLFIAWGWMFASSLSVAGGLFLLLGCGALFMTLGVRGDASWEYRLSGESMRVPNAFLSAPLNLLVAPVMISIGAVTMIRSLIWKKRGLTTWKGRVYTH